MITRNFSTLNDTQEEYAAAAEHKADYYMQACEVSMQDYRETGRFVYLTNANALANQSDHWLAKASSIRAMDADAFAMWLAYRHLIGAAR